MTAKDIGKTTNEKGELVPVWECSICGARATKKDDITPDCFGCWYIDLKKKMITFQKGVRYRKEEK